MFQPGEEPRFTIEQIDLLQRLRRTGITQSELLHALDTLDHLDRHHGHTWTHKSSHLPPPTCSPVAAFSSTTSTAAQTTFPESSFSPPPHNNSNNFDMACPPVPLPAAAVAQNGLASVSNGKLSPPRFPMGVVTSSGTASGYGFETNEEDIDLDDKVEELMRRDSAVMKEEIKAFLANRRISQAVVAQVTGISQSRISHWLLQHGSDLSEQKKRAFFRWYQLERSNPGATLAMRAAPLALEDMMDWPQAPPPFGSTPGTFRLRRGSRFTWRKECLAVMESYFSDNQYPDEAKREEIAGACNAVIQKPGKKLSEMERVTSLKVYNWFANRRKDIKRRANIEATILESHGIEVQSPGCQSNGDEVDGGDFTEQGCEVSMFDPKRTPSRTFGFARADVSSTAQVPGLMPPWYFGRVAAGGSVRGGPVPPRSLLSGPGAQAEDGARLAPVSWSPPPMSTEEEPTGQGVLSETSHPIATATTTEMVPAACPEVDGAASSLETEIKTEVLEDD